MPSNASRSIRGSTDSGTTTPIDRSDERAPIRDSASQPAAPDGAADPNPDSRHQKISETAYRLYASRGFVGGLELEDWLQAEAEIDTTPDRPLA